MPTATSTLRVYQFRHDRKSLAATQPVALVLNQLSAGNSKWRLNEQAKGSRRQQS
jgi:hypothetical protein